MKPIQVGLLGIGTVGSGVFNVLQRNQEEIRRRAGRGIEIAMVADLDTTRAKAVVGDAAKVVGDAREIMAVFTFVVPRGLPLIYTGQEIGYDHSFAFFDRDPIPRYEANAFTGFYRRLTALRHDNPALAAGPSALTSATSAPRSRMARRWQRSASSM